MNIEDQLRQTLHDWAAEAPLDGARPAARARPATRPRQTARRPLALAAGLLVAVGAVAAVNSSLDVEPPPPLQTPEAPPGLPQLPPYEWDAQIYSSGFAAIRGAPTVHIALEDIPEGVTETRFEGVRAYTVRRGNDVRVIIPTSPYSGTLIPFCPTSGWFESPVHGEMWDETGQPANELPTRALAQIPVYIDGDEVTIDLAGLTPGAPAETPRTPQPAVGPHCVSSGGPNGSSG